MKLNFCFNIDDGEIKCFTLPQKKFENNIEINIDPLPRLFGLTEISNLNFYVTFLTEISEIKTGKKEVFEASYDVGGGLIFELKITKETTYCEMWSAEGAYLKLNTNEFEELVKSWIKFVEIITITFSKK